MSNILFSIVIPTYNREKIIVKTIQSVLSQTYTNFELIIVDDGSTDNTEKFVRNIKDKRIKFFKKENEERGAARNYGTNKAKGDYITFLDSDDLLYSKYLEEAKYFIKKNNSINIFHQLFEVRSKDNKLIRSADYSNRNAFKSLITKGNFMACQGLFLKADFAKSNLFIEDRNLAGSEDYELWLRISTTTNIVINPVVTSALIDHSDRSVIKIDVDKLIKRKELMLHYLFSNKLINSKLLKYKKILKAGAYSYISLHIALSNQSKKIALKYLFKAIMQSLLFIFKRRFFAILKHLLF
jgi:glycosyltransferase involved in cell wall biosynthesis